METQREVKRRCAFLCKCRPFETSYISRGDRFAAQIDFVTSLCFTTARRRRYALRVTAAGRCPPIYRLLFRLASFHFSLRIEVGSDCFLYFRQGKIVWQGYCRECRTNLRLKFWQCRCGHFPNYIIVNLLIVEDMDKVISDSSQLVPWYFRMN